MTEDIPQAALPATVSVVERTSGNPLQIFGTETELPRGGIHARCEIYEQALEAAQASS